MGPKKQTQSNPIKPNFKTTPDEKTGEFINRDTGEVIAKEMAIEVEKGL